MSTTDKYIVPIEEAIARLPKGKYVHTFLEGGPTLIGADHLKKGLIADMRKYGVENAGAAAARMGHTLVIRSYRGCGPLFIQAEPAAVKS